MSEISTIKFGNIAVAHSQPSNKLFNTPILFVHGAWGGKYQFEKWQDYANERGWETYAIDLRGHHDNPLESPHGFIRGYADDVERVISEIGPCYLVGHSQGGLVAQLVASRNSNVKKVVLLASAPPMGIIYINAFILRMLAYLPTMLMRKSISLTKADAVHFLFNDRDSGAQAKLIPEPVDVGIITTKISRIPCPVLVVAATDDRLLPVSVEKRIARKFGATYIEIPKTGHMLMLEENWQESIEKILDWCSL